MKKPLDLVRRTTLQNFAFLSTCHSTRNNSQASSPCLLYIMWWVNVCVLLAISTYKTQSDSAPCCLTWTYASTFAETTNTCHWRSRLKNPSGRLNLDCWECGCKSDKQAGNVQADLYIYIYIFVFVGLWKVWNQLVCLWLENFTGNRKFSFLVLRAGSPRKVPLKASN